mgnify:CR=1 FL=1
MKYTTTNKALHKSKFNFLVPLGKEYYILYNTFSCAIAIIDNELKECLDKEDFSKIPPATLNYLIKQEFIVPSDLDEIKRYLCHFHRSIYDTRNLDYTIILTYDCNFACIYCYERLRNIISPEYMDIETAERTASYIEKQAKKFEAKNITITLYGGEPLLNIKVGLKILNRIKSFCEKNDIKLRLKLITNGSLMSREIVEELLNYNLNYIQITIDGTKEVHDKRRPFKSKKGSFNTIIKNLLDTVDISPPGSILIRFTLDKMTYKNFPNFIDYLLSLGLKDKVKLGIGYLTGIPDGSPCAKWVLEEEDLARKMFELWKIAMEKGFRYYGKVSHNICAAKAISSEIIDPKGDVYKCWGLINNEKFCVRNINEDDYRPIFYEYIERELPQKCKKCNLLPYCSGGCFEQAYIKTGNPFNITCVNAYRLKVELKLYVMERYRDVLKERGLL